MIVLVQYITNCSTVLQPMYFRDSLKLLFRCNLMVRSLCAAQLFSLCALCIVQLGVSWTGVVNTDVSRTISATQAVVKIAYDINFRSNSTTEVPLCYEFVLPTTLAARLAYLSAVNYIGLEVAIHPPVM